MYYRIDINLRCVYMCLNIQRISLFSIVFFDMISTKSGKNISDLFFKTSIAACWLKMLTKSLSTITVSPP